MLTVPRPLRSLALASRRAAAFLIGALLASSPPPAMAQDALQSVRDRLYAGQLAEAEAALSAVLARTPAPVEARFALGSIRFLRSVERLGQSLHRHGFEAQELLAPHIFWIPVPPNPQPAPLTYEGFRAIVQTFRDDVLQAEAILAEIGDAEVKLPLDLARVRLDLNGDGRGDQAESLAAIVAQLRPRAGAQTPSASTPEFVVAFDTGDVYWLRGYAHQLAGIAEFWLAHDFRRTFEQSFHLLFPRAGLPGAAVFAHAARNADGRMSNEAMIGEAIAFVHLIQWPVVEPDRMKRARHHFKAMAALSRDSWRAILAETDDDHEWVPGPRQTSLFPGRPVTEDMVGSWLRIVDTLDAVLDGRKLVPHWRFAKGMDLRRFFDEPRPFDPVLLATGHGALPFLADGETISSREWNEMVRAFQREFLFYALWFN
jgi:hypothetical protein